MRNAAGSRTIARASATRWRWPPESWRGRRSSRWSISSDSATRCDAARAARRLLEPADAQRVADVLAPRSCAGRARSSGTPSRRRGRAAGCASRRGRRCAPCRRSAARGRRGCAAPSSCRSPTGRAARGTRRRARRGRASAAPATAASKRFSMPRKLTSLMRGLGGPVDSRTISSPRTQLALLDVAALADGREHQLGGARAHRRRVLAHRRQPDAVVRRPAARRRSRPPRRPRGTRRPRRSSESMRSMATPSLCSRWRSGRRRARPRAGRAGARPAEKACGLRSTSASRACWRANAKRSVAEIGEVADHRVHRLLLVDVDRARRGGRACRRTRRASSGTPRSSRSAEARRVLAPGRRR